MTRKEEIAVIKRCEKSIYDRRKYLKAKRERTYLLDGLWDAEVHLWNMRSRLEDKLK